MLAVWVSQSLSWNNYAGSLGQLIFIDKIIILAVWLSQPLMQRLLCW